MIKTKLDSKKDIFTSTGLDNSELKTIFNAVQNKTFKTVKVLKNNQRSTVSLINIDGTDYICKIPTEKNRHPWQRILSFFRRGESSREFEALEKLKALGLNAPEPLIALEVKNKFNLITDSFIVMAYIEGDIYPPIENILQILKIFYKNGLLHGDPQGSNFILSKNTNKVYIIDSKIKKNHFGKFSICKEIVYLENDYQISVPEFHDTVFYKIARIIDKIRIVTNALKHK